MENFTHCMIVFSLCFFAVYTTIGILAALAVGIIGGSSKEGLKNSITLGMKTLKLPYMVVATIFFSCIIWGWPFILRLMWQDEEREKNQGSV